MGGITSGTGLFSGIDTQSLINQLIQIEARPRVLAQNRIAQLQRQQSAFLGLNSSLNSLRTQSRAFDVDDVFNANSTTSSNSDVLTATAGTNAPEGSFQFVVNRLVSTQQQLTRGFNDRDTSALGADSFTFEDIRGSVQRETELVELNGGNGIDRGVLKITIGGETTEIDLSAAVTVSDVIDEINSAGGIDITARAVGDRLVLESESGAAFTVADGQGNDTASSLGITGSSVGGVLNGNNIRTVSELTPLSTLNDGQGVAISGSTRLESDDTIDSQTFDITIIDRAGNNVNIFLGETVRETLDDEGEVEGTETVQAAASTLGDVIERINQQASDAGVGVTASISADGSGLTITDTSGSTTNKLVVKEAFGSGSTAVDQLGIDTGPAGVASNSVEGERLLSGLNSLFVGTLNGGSGIDGANLTTTALSIAARDGASFNVDLSSLDSRSSLTEVIEQINSDASGAGVGVRAELNEAGNGIALVDSSGGSGSLVVGGDAAADLGLETSGLNGNRLNGGSLQAQYIYGNTRLEDLNLVESLGAGTIRITDASGGIDELSFTASNGALVFGGSNRLETVDDLITLLRGRPNTDISIAINDTGDGLVFTDTSGGAGTLRIEDVSGRIARSFGFRGESEDDGSGTQVLNGSLERTVEFNADDTLEDAVDRINSAGVGVSATIVNNGGSFNPFRINFTSRNSGADGRVLIDSRGFDLGLNTLSRGQDAVAFFGSADPADGVLLTSSRNTLDNVIRGVSIDLKSASNEAVNITVSRDTASIEEQVQSFVDSYNEVLEQIESLDFFDIENEERGVLLGDPTIATIRRQLFNTIQGEPIGVEGQFTRLFQVGVRIGEGAKLEFNRERFRSAMEEDPENVEQLFAARRLDPREPIQVLDGVEGITVANTGDDTFSELGVAERIAELVNDLTNSIDGLLTNKSNSLDRQIEVQESRIEILTERLNDRRARFERQFLNLEQALASLQSQQSALSQLG